MDFEIPADALVIQAENCVLTKAPFHTEDGHTRMSVRVVGNNTLDITLNGNGNSGNYTVSLGEILKERPVQISSELWLHLTKTTSYADTGHRKPDLFTITVFTVTTSEVCVSASPEYDPWVDADES